MIGVEDGLVVQVLAWSEGRRLPGDVRIQQMNHVNSHNGYAMMTAQHHH